MIKPVWNKGIVYCSRESLKYPSRLNLGNNLAIEVNPESQIISLYKNARSIGYEVFEKEKNEIKCVDILVNPEERQNGFGGLLHSISVMLMKANRAKRIHLDSLPQAVRTHYNKGFRTASKSIWNAETNLKSIIHSQTPFETLKIRAQDLLGRLNSEGKNAIKEADSLYDEYLANVFAHNIAIEDAKLPETLYMELTLDNAKKNNTLYNNILRNFGIGYKI